jgi:hypothetical protein
MQAPIGNFIKILGFWWQSAVISSRIREVREKPELDSYGERSTARRHLISYDLVIDSTDESRLQLCKGRRT